MSSRRVVAVVGALAAALVAASCTTEQDSNPGPTLTSTTSTTEVPVSTSEPSVDTTEATSTSSSTTTLPTEPVAAEIALFTGGAEGGWLFLGTWQVDHWQQADGGRSVPAGTAMTITNLDGDVAATAGAETEACFDERFGPTLQPAIAAPDPPGFGYGAIATSGHDRPLRPRPMAVTPTGPDAYRALGAEIFAGDDVDASQGTITQVVVTDLDGDGDDEAIVSFEFVQPSAGPGAPGDFSALFVVDIATRTPATVLATHVARGLPDSMMPITERSRVIDVADYNGDGSMEVAVHTWYYEGAGVTVYEYDGVTLVAALTTGCGA